MSPIIITRCLGRLERVWLWWPPAQRQGRRELRNDGGLGAGVPHGCGVPLAHPGPSPPLRVSCHHRQGTRMHLTGGKPGWVSSALNVWTETLPVTTLPWRRRPVLSWAARHRRGSLSLSKFRAKKLPTSLVLFLLVSICFHLSSFSFSCFLCICQLGQDIGGEYC